MNRIIILLISIAFLVTCKTDQEAKQKPVVTKRVQVPVFSSDGAYQYIEKQLSFGYRIPGTDEHKACKDWMVEEMRSLGAEVHEQKFTAKLHDGVSAESYNIIAQINPKHKSRIFVAAHWDSRRESDYDANEDNKEKPLLGADDGGSGVGVALELVKTLSENPIDMGVDIILFDAEDQGETQGKQETWCLGSQYWARNIYPKKYRPKYGILLDMVGAKDAQFKKDDVSMRYAPEIVNKIWALAASMGHGDQFLDFNGCSVIDDHLFVNLIAGIKTIDIINQVNQGDEDANACFGDHWHTQGDDMSIIDKKTLKKVGQVVTAVLYKESGNQL